MISVVPVPVDLLEFFWPFCVSEFERVVERANGEVSLGTIKAQIKRGDSLLVVILDGDKLVAVNTLEIAVFDTGLRVLVIPSVAGERLEEWMDQFLEFAMYTARERNCTQLRGYAARKGWMKKLEPRGWSECFTTLKCDVVDK